MCRINLKLYVLIFTLLSGCFFTQLLAVDVDNSYSQGKALFFAKKDKAAEAVLSLVPLSSSYNVKAQYILGASLIRQGQLEKAENIFSKIILLPIKSIDDRKVVDLAILARARILYYQNKLRESVLAYQLLPADSDFKNKMLYELAMVYIRYGDKYYDNPEYSSQLYQSAEACFVKLVSDDKQTALDPRVQLSLADLAMRRNDTAKALISYRQLLDNFINIQKQLQYLSHNTVQFVDDLLAGRGFGERINSVWLTSQSEIKPYLEQIVILQKISKQLNSLQAGYREILASKSNSLDAALILKQENSLKILKSRLVEINQQSRAVMLKEIPVLSLKWSSEANWLLVGAENGLMRGFLRTKFAKDKMLETIETVKINELSHINLNLGFLRGVEK